MSFNFTVITIDKFTQVIIVGGGLAGMAAAIESVNLKISFIQYSFILSCIYRALQAGAKVVLVDKEAYLGGNSAKASSGKFDYI
jgi:succinate dehydrogenase/fumarate reductase flavoprotein subunit